MNDTLMHDLAQAMVEYQNRISEIICTWSDDQIEACVARCRREAHPQPGDSHNFEMPEWDYVAGLLLRDLYFRRVCAKAAAYTAHTGESYYCVRCEGACTPEHLRENEE